MLFCFFINNIKQSRIRIIITTMTDFNEKMEISCTDFYALINRVENMENEIKILKNEIKISNEVNKNLLNSFELYFRDSGISRDENVEYYDEENSEFRGRKLTISDLDVDCGDEYSDLSFSDDEEIIPEPPKLVRQSNYPEYACRMEMLDLDSIINNGRSFSSSDISANFYSRVPEFLKKVNPLDDKEEFISDIA